GLPDSHELLHEEVFGPICAIVAASSTEDALRRANAVRYGLAAAVYTSDLTAALTATRELRAGQIKVNAPTTGVDFYLPFGGEQDSSYGQREQGKAAQEFYTSLHTVSVAPSVTG
ncbi:MAG TPA: aldehyde dehydrogenase family protein, partial [Pseudonocardiaceae bacterium]